MVEAAQTVSGASTPVPIDGGVYFYFDEYASESIGSELSLAYMDALGRVTVLSSQCTLAVGVVRYDDGLIVAAGTRFTRFSAHAAASTSFGVGHGTPDSFVVLGRDLYFIPDAHARVEHLTIPELLTN